MSECNGICVTAGDIGLPEYGSMVAYAHPDCPEHGDPLEEDENEELCMAGYDEEQRFVRESDVT